jgi:hypothetical protein
LSVEEEKVVVSEDKELPQLFLCKTCFDNMKNNGSEEKKEGTTSSSSKLGKYAKWMIPATILGGAAAVVAAPIAIAGLGFGVGGGVIFNFASKTKVKNQL